MSWLAAAIYVGLVVVILRGIRDWHRQGRRRREHGSFLAGHERDVRHRQIERERRESQRIGFRR